MASHLLPTGNETSKTPKMAIDSRSPPSLSLAVILQCDGAPLRRNPFTLELQWSLHKLVSLAIEHQWRSRGRAISHCRCRVGAEPIVGVNPREVCHLKGEMEDCYRRRRGKSDRWRGVLRNGRIRRGKFDIVVLDEEFGIGWRRERELEGVLMASESASNTEEVKEQKFWSLGSLSLVWFNSGSH